MVYLIVYFYALTFHQVGVISMMQMYSDAVHLVSYSLELADNFRMPSYMINQTAFQ